MKNFAKKIKTEVTIKDVAIALLMWISFLMIYVLITTIK